MNIQKRYKLSYLWDGRVVEAEAGVTSGAGPPFTHRPPPAWRVGSTKESEAGLPASRRLIGRTAIRSVLQNLGGSCRRRSTRPEKHPMSARARRHRGIKIKGGPSQTTASDMKRV